MYIPTPNEYAKQHGHTPFPPRWERWLSSLRNAILTGRGIAGRNMAISVYPGEGTVYGINADGRGRNPISGGGTPTPPPTGACCEGAFCEVITEAACVSAGGTYQGDHTNCDPNPCVPCSGTKSSVIFAGVTAPGCCVGGGNKYVFPSTDIFAIDINRGTGFVFETCVSPLSGTKCWGFFWGTEGLPYMVSDHLVFLTEDCSDTPPGLSTDNPFSVFVDCNHGQTEYSGLPLGWFIVAWGVRPWFAAFGLSDLDVMSPVGNQLTCGVQDSNCAIFGTFVGGLAESVGEGGTAILT